MSRYKIKKFAKINYYLYANLMGSLPISAVTFYRNLPEAKKAKRTLIQQSKALNKEGE